MSRDFFPLVFLIKHLLLVPLDTPRKDFEFFRIFKELFEFVIDSPVYSPPGSWDSPVVNTLGVDLNWLTKEPSSAKYFKESRLPVINTLGSLDSLVYYSRESFFVNCSYACSKYTKKSTPRVFITGESRLPCVFTTGESRLPGVFTTGELRLAGVFITRELFWIPGSHFIDFNKHTTIFKGSIILKIVCRLL